MSNINKVIIEGNLTKACELSRWNDGTPYIRFTIANNESYKDKDGNWVDIPSFFDCMCKGAYAESMSKHLLKGRRVTVEGRLKQNRWKDENENGRSAVVIKVQEISLAPGAFQVKENNESKMKQSEMTQNESNYDYSEPVDNYSQQDFDIPF